MPGATPITAPVEDTVAIVAFDVPHVPPAIDADSAIVSPWQTESGPVMLPASARGCTVIATVVVAAPQELVTVYDIKPVPRDIPVITPVDDTVATEVEPLFHVPPAVDAPSVSVRPRHTSEPPVIEAATGSGLTVTGWDAVAVPHTVVTV